MIRVSRRALIVMPVAIASMARVAVAQPSAAESYEAAERFILAGRTAIASGISIVMPQLSENGKSVDLALRVDSPMTAEDHVTAIHILAEKNPYPLVASFALTPRAGRAEIATRIRLATTQTILVLAETNRGQVHRVGREVVVILGACMEGG